MKIAVIQLTTTENKENLVRCLRNQGFTWRGGNEEITYSSLANYPYLHLYEDKNITWGNKHYEEAITVMQYLHSSIYQQPKNQTDMSTITNTTAAEKQLSITKTEVILLGKKKREVTITVLTTDFGRIRAGYAVRNPEDKKSDQDFAKQISTGRALSDKTTLVNYEYTQDLKKKFVLYAVAEQLFRDISYGKVEIKIGK